MENIKKEKQNCKHNARNSIAIGTHPMLTIKFRLNLNGMGTAAAAAHDKARTQRNKSIKEAKWMAGARSIWRTAVLPVCARRQYSEFAIIYSLNTRTMNIGSIIFILFCVRCGSDGGSRSRQRNPKQIRNRCAHRIVNDGVGGHITGFHVWQCHSSTTEQWTVNMSICLRFACDYTLLSSIRASVNLILIQFHKSIKSISSFGTFIPCAARFFSLLATGIAVSTAPSSFASLWDTRHNGIGGEVGTRKKTWRAPID